MNWSCPAWLDWLHGGLQFQIEHHLFPSLPRHNLRQASLLVRPLCQDMGLPYHCPSFFGVNQHACSINTFFCISMSSPDLMCIDVQVCSAHLCTCARRSVVQQRCLQRRNVWYCMHCNMLLYAMQAASCTCTSCRLLTVKQTQFRSSKLQGALCQAMLG